MKKLLGAILFFTSALFAEEELIPPSLQKGDLIAIVSPAFFLQEEEEAAFFNMNRRAKWLQKQGYRTIFYPARIHRTGYLAGTDEERAEAMMDAWKNEEVKAIWCFRGGYGSGRILDLLDYEWIKDHPKIFIGMSDVTALHQALFQKTGLRTFLAPVLKYFNSDSCDFDEEYAFSSLEEMLQQPWVVKIALPPSSALNVIKHGIAQGKLVGGNLTMLATACGTQWQTETEGKILLLEDVSETVYRIDRMLWQLREAGLLKRPAAVILGSFANCEPHSEYSFSIEQVFEHYFGDAPYPVIGNFPSGHDQYQTALPLNTLLEIDTESMTVKVLEEAVR